MMVRVRYLGRIGALAAALGVVAVPALAQIQMGSYPTSERVINGAKAGSSGEIRAGLLEGGSPNARNSSGKPALAVAAGQGSYPSVQVLLDAGANVNLAGNEDGRTALHEAARRGEPDIVALLLSRQADVNVMDREGRTPLSLAAEIGSAPIIRSLLAAKADPSRADYSGREPLDWAKDGRKAAAVRALEETQGAQ